VLSASVESIKVQVLAMPPLAPDARFLITVPAHAPEVLKKDQTGTTTYYPCYKQYVKIDWSKYLEE